MTSLLNQAIELQHMDLLIIKENHLSGFLSLAYSAHTLRYDWTVSISGTGCFSTNVQKRLYQPHIHHKPQ